MQRRTHLAGLLALVAGLPLLPGMALAQDRAQPGLDKVEALQLGGESLLLSSAILGETRRINVYLPEPYLQDAALRLPLLVMPDGGMAEDFPHIAGLLQVGIANGTVRPFILVGIENTQRRRDLTPPSTDARDLAIAPQIGGSAAFRGFLRDELLPLVQARYRCTQERALIGESLAGLFVLETLLREPELFGTGIAIDPSLWWNRGQLIQDLKQRSSALAGHRLFIASADRDGNTAPIRQFVQALRRLRPSGLDWHYQPMAGEGHATVYHPAALIATRRLFKPPKA
ncbi:alpha/beta hydrolase [Mitsuaria sp. WAJ17]|uniref:alpha/beta hydrolase n=1 Tax=Mitsuaria sp. WAJ17 TaxID=2761452 RepID=UPI001601DD42|nr:alpha/beta hydrolase-fold protein [Mitsuaria sp. WAJ17]MBB2483984.1 alpha/beta hydrolase [Mitsuaria sp. WAJ17]